MTVVATGISARSQLRKPLDLGNGLVCASLDPEGAWLSLGTTHTRHGFIELTALPRFEERWREDPAAVRRYRQLMTESRYAFLTLDAEGWLRQASNRAPTGQRAIEQRLLLTANQPGMPPPVLRFRGALDRPPFAEITEVSPLPPTRATANLTALGPMLRIEASILPAVAEVRVDGSSATWELADDGARLVIEGDPPGVLQLELLITCSLREAQS
jgi:hypothetical protein